MTLAKFTACETVGEFKNEGRFGVAKMLLNSIVCFLLFPFLTQIKTVAFDHFRQEFEPCTKHVLKRSMMNVDIQPQHDVGKVGLMERPCCHFCTLCRPREEARI